MGLLFLYLFCESDGSGRAEAVAKPQRRGWSGQRDGRRRGRPMCLPRAKRTMVRRSATARGTRDGSPKSDRSKQPKPKEIYKKKSIKIEKENIKEYKNDLSNFSY